MKTKLTFALLFVVNVMSAQMLKRGNEKLDTLCQTKFTAVYQYSINTSDVDKKPVTDSIRLHGPTNAICFSSKKTKR